MYNRIDAVSKAPRSEGWELGFLGLGFHGFGVRRVFREPEHKSPKPYKPPKAPNPKP